MHRRAFLISVGALAVSSLSARHKRRALVCSPFNAAGVQQCEAGIESSILDVTASDTQHASEWCWAACIQAVFSYYGHEVSQERIVKESWGDIVNMPGSPSLIMRALNRT